jgi:hypothetical protein
VSQMPDGMSQSVTIAGVEQDQSRDASPANPPSLVKRYDLEQPRCCSKNRISTHPCGQHATRLAFLTLKLPSLRLKQECAGHQVSTCCLLVCLVNLCLTLSSVQLRGKHADSPLLEQDEPVAAPKDFKAVVVATWRAAVANV